MKIACPECGVDVWVLAENADFEEEKSVSAMCWYCKAKIQYYAKAWSADDST